MVRHYSQVTVLVRSLTPLRFLDCRDVGEVDMVGGNGRGAMMRLLMIRRRYGIAAMGLSSLRLVRPLRSFATQTISSVRVEKAGKYAVVQAMLLCC